MIGGGTGTALRQEGHNNATGNQGWWSHQTDAAGRRTPTTIFDRRPPATYLEHVCVMIKKKAAALDPFFLPACVFLPSCTLVCSLLSHFISKFSLSP
jgi:hypothetical protein